ncbi:pyrroloquinoline quinone biosynthesis protein PqqF [Pseudomonas sp. Teo4]|uniref:pyrroloquinoline quinone biosynthesis protein PqqF n=1 Tax=Pseudomonas sp. Teo4 TaxID=3064528 RepID=UPI002ABB43FA|nr:pyrroloquinoline quinone biosynthesis protein PqqF [Pseudomonas sp. Teo4]MDZ3995011.1 hypothetical protein [Pseudomonas sp. Teo4]
MPDAIRHLTLTNGLQLTLRHAPRLKRSAAAVRVHAGSHDAPPRWPGLAHFLEHLFFLGTTLFPLNDGLMRYVQTLGGQVNASTRERTTDFFLEVPTTALAGGLERLCQMLAEPDLGIERQRREREVIHAEFIAWSRNPEAQRQFSLLQEVSPYHPLSGFHAGNRHTLALQSPDFQQALRGFHQRFYQGGQMVLSLTGPQTLDELEQLGKLYGSQFASGEKVRQSPPPALSATARSMTFAHEALGDGAEQALDLLVTLLSDTRPGGWLATLRQRSWLQGFKAETLYAYAGQLLWHIELQLSASASADEANAMLQGWFGFIRQADSGQLNAEFALLQQSREQLASALELARRDSAGKPFSALDDNGLLALRALLDNLPWRNQGQWHLPETDVLSITELPAGRGSLPAALAVSNELPATRQFAAVYLRWCIKSPLRERLHGLLVQALKPLQERAERAGVQLHLDASGECWQLRASGLPAAVIRTVEQALAQLRNPDSWQVRPQPEPALIPIRALLKQLPDVLQPAKPEPLPSCVLDQLQLDGVWQHAPWHGLAVGLDDDGLQGLGAALQACPGNGSVPEQPRLWARRRWHHAEIAGSENALLLFCPLQTADEATGRLLAQLLQGPVYQRLRVELQLGYAVFSAFRQIEGINGLLFGVQSPHASHDEILDHLKHLLLEGVQLDPNARQALAAQFCEPNMVNAEVVEWAWQAHLATHSRELSDLRWSILQTQQSDLDDLLHACSNPDAAWLCLANAAPPDETWQQA